MKRGTKTPALKPLEVLQRTDKWYLGGGNRLLWSPPFPAYLDAPGFWDKAHYYNHELQPLFTWTLLDEEGKEIPVSFESRRWNPAELTQRFSASCGGSTIRIEEVKSVLPSDIALSVVKITNGGARRLKIHLVVWTVQEQAPTKGTVIISDIARRDGALTFRRQQKAGTRPEFSFACALGIAGRATSYAVNLSEGANLQPKWRLTPFFESASAGKLPNTTRLGGVSPDGLIFIGLETVLTIPRAPLHPKRSALPFPRTLRTPGRTSQAPSKQRGESP